ncbi:MAG: sulfite exporter TauE/SafE family protein [Endomicrobiales bacterium]
MNTLLFTVLVGTGSVAAGMLGALTGLGGGVVIVPLLTLAFGVDIRYAIGASLVSVIATSSGLASVNVRKGCGNIRVGMFLEIAGTLGALLGASLTAVFAPKLIALVFGAVLIYSAYLASRPPQEKIDHLPDPLTARLRMNGTYPSDGGKIPYTVHNVPGGFGVMFAAGALSGLLGIGSGALKVLAMDRIMRLPFKVSTTTSSFMIGVTAAASAGIYLGKGYMSPGLVMPVMLGVLAGSMLGARILASARTRTLRAVFTLVILALGLQMIFNALAGRF